MTARHPRLYWNRDCTLEREWFRFLHSVPINLLWVLNSAAFYGMLFATDQWLRLVHTTWTVFPNALSMLIQYWSLIHRHASSDRHRLDAEPGSALPLIHGAPLRLRCENELGVKFGKWSQAIKFVRDCAQLGFSQGGYNKDHEFHGNRMSI